MRLFSLIGPASAAGMACCLLAARPAFARDEALKQGDAQARLETGGRVRTDARFHLEDSANGYSLDAHSGVTGQPNVRRKRYPFVLKGSAVIATQEIVLTSDAIRGLLGDDAALANRVTLLHAESVGLVRFIRKAPNPKKDHKIVLEGARAIYEANGATGTLNLSGGTTLTDSNPLNAAGIVARAPRGSATVGLLPKGQESPLEYAKLEGGVDVDVAQAAGGIRIKAHGDHMTLENSVRDRHLLLEGAVTMHASKGSNAGTTSVERLDLKLNSRGEVTSYTGGNGVGGNLP